MTNGDLISFLLAKSSITDLVGQRIYEDAVPNDCENQNRPVMRVALLDGTQDQIQSGVSNVDYLTYQIDVYALAGVSSQGVVGRQDIETAVMTELDGYFGLIGTSYVSCEMVQRQHLFEPLEDDRDQARYRSSMRFDFVVED